MSLRLATCLVLLTLATGCVFDTGPGLPSVPPGDFGAEDATGPQPDLSTEDVGSDFGSNGDMSDGGAMCVDACTVEGAFMCASTRPRLFGTCRRSNEGCLERVLMPCPEGQRCDPEGDVDAPCRCPERCPFTGMECCQGTDYQLCQLVEECQGGRWVTEECPVDCENDSCPGN